MIEGVVYSLLNGLVSGRCYANTFLQDGKLPPWPAIRYTVVGSEEEGDACGGSSVDTDDVRVQVDFVAKTHGAMIALRDSGIAAIATHDPKPDRVGGFQTFDTETKTHRAMVEFLFQQSSD